MIIDKADEDIDDFFSINSFQVSNWIGNINESSDLILNCLHLLFQILHKMNSKQGGYVDSPD